MGEKIICLFEMEEIFEFLLLHIEGSYEKYIRENEKFQRLKEYSPAE